MSMRFPALAVALLALLTEQQVLAAKHVVMSKSLTLTLTLTLTPSVVTNEPNSMSTRVIRTTYRSAHGRLGLQFTWVQESEVRR